MGGGDSLTPNAAGGVYAVQGGAGERPVTVSAQQGELVEVSPRNSRSGGGTVINIINKSNSQVSAQSSQQGGIENIEVLIESVTTRSMVSGSLGNATQQRFNVAERFSSR